MVKVCGVLYFVLIINLKFHRGSGLVFDLDAVKNNFFLTTEFNSTQDTSDVNCLIEMNAIQNGLKTNELWAIKTVNAWGKIPLELSNETVYEFGEYSQCLNIKRNNELYKTQYCLGQLMLNSERINSVKHLATVGICFPASCSFNWLQSQINELIQEKMENLSIKFDEESCQSKEYYTTLKTLDWIVIGFLGILLSLALSSTVYDILFTKINRKKSEILLTFSFYTNGKKLLSCEKTKSSSVINCLNGIRAISALWVILSHIFRAYTNVSSMQNKNLLFEIKKQYHSLIYLSAPLAVDTFFLISGLLISNNMLNHLEKSKGKLNVLRLYLHRYTRLTPVLVFTFLFEMSLLKFLGDGPIWPLLIKGNSSNCKQYWWSTLLYIQNYINPKKLCYTHSWYLCADMQLFLISPAIIYSIYKFKIKTIPIFLVLILGCIGCTVISFVKYGINMRLMDDTYLSKVYYPTHIHVSSWLIGIMFGYILHETQKRSIRMSKLLNTFMWSLCFVLAMAIIIVNYPLYQLDSKATPFESGLYDALRRIGWSIVLCYIIFACHKNYGGCVNWFLSHSLWQPFSRLSYSIYMLHNHLVCLTVGTLKTPPLYSELNLFFQFIWISGITILFSIIVTLLFESPIAIIEKYLLGSEKTTEQNTKSSNDEQIKPQTNQKELKKSQ